MLSHLLHRASFEDLTVGGRLLLGLPGFLRHPFSLDQARRVLADRLGSREERFLLLARRAIFDRPSSSYRLLFGLAGCEYGDLVRLVRERQLEHALADLAGCGIYLSVDEFKGRRPVRRGSVTFSVERSGLLNPLPRSHLLVQTSGSRGASTSVPVDLAFIRDHAVNTFLTLDAHGGVGWHHAHWGLPGGAALTNLLEFAVGGAPAERWFSQIDPAARGLHPRYRWSGRVLNWGGRLAGVPLPAAEHVPLGDPLPIVRWMVETVQAGATPHLWTYASGAVRVAQAASAAGLSLEGARFTAGGEPSTAARVAEIRRTGASVAPRYGSTETDIISYACLSPSAPDDMHLLHDRHVVIQPPGDLEAGLSGRALLFSSLLASTPLMLLNVSLGDEAVLLERSCGCPLERYGWSSHLHTVRSFEKLTLGGGNVLDVDVVRILEEVLPKALGGSPLHYQLVEEAVDSGSGLRLLVHPDVGPLDSRQVGELFLRALASGTGADRLVALQWRTAGMLQVERRPPLTTGSGKVHHLHRDTRLVAGSRGGAVS